MRAFIQCWAMRALALFISAVSLCAQAEAAGTLYEKLEGSFDATGEPMRVRAVHSGRAGCATGCAEWISAEGMMVQGSAQLFGIVVNSLRGRKIPILIHSHGGTVVEAMLIGRLIRARGCRRRANRFRSLFRFFRRLQGRIERRAWAAKFRTG